MIQHSLLSDPWVRLLNSKWKTKRHSVAVLGYCSTRFSSFAETNLLISVCVCIYAEQDIYWLSRVLHIFSSFSHANQIEFLVIVICFSGSVFIKFLACTANTLELEAETEGTNLKCIYTHIASIYWKAKWNDYNCLWAIVKFLHASFVYRVLIFPFCRWFQFPMLHVGVDRFRGTPHKLKKPKLRGLVEICWMNRTWWMSWNTKWHPSKLSKRERAI